MLVVCSHAPPPPPWRSKNSMYEPSTRIPLIIAPYGSAKATYPGAAGAVVTALSSHIDVAPTVMELVGASPSALPGARGSSLVPFLVSPPLRSPELSARAAAHPDYVAAEYHRCDDAERKGLPSFLGRCVWVQGIASPTPPP